MLYHLLFGKVLENKDKIFFSDYITLTRTVGSLWEGEPNADRVNIYKAQGARYKCNLDNFTFLLAIEIQSVI